MFGREDANILDLKMGVNTITANIKANPSRMDKRLIKDQATTTATLGMKVIGYVIKSQQRRIEEKFYKFPYKTKDEIPEVLRRLFSFPRDDSQFGTKEVDYKINLEAQAFVLSELRRLLEFLELRS
jgi:hypothetical protein